MTNLITFHLDDSKNLRGGERQVLYLAEELKKLGVENYIVTRKNSPLYFKSKEKTIKTLTLPYLFEWDIISAAMLAYKIKSINKSKKKVIIHSHTGHTSSLAFLASFFIKAKIIVHRRVDFKIKTSFLSRIKYTKADYIISISEAIKKILIEYGIDKNKIIVIPSSFRLEKKELKKIVFKDKKIIIGSLIALVPHKDPLNLIRAAKIVIESNNNCFFVVGGEGPLKDESAKLIKDLGITDNFQLTGYVEDNASFLNSLDIFILPSREEGLGSVLIEAMNFGLPLVGTDAGGIPEIIENGYNGFVVPRENPQKLAEAILMLIKDKELREKFGKNSFERSKNFTSEIMAKRTLEVYEKAVKDT
ncbi:MAG: glycosyltransferase family 4 protein [Elusimicrobiales bacterium]|jgi:glycosyltransferase involved in cell wall biosynthesis|nr:glycosyltransferase family 4 protein [Elusimicrobiales bacterium]